VGEFVVQAEVPALPTDDIASFSQKLEAKYDEPSLRLVTS
jgi:hypothetical protein